MDSVPCWSCAHCVGLRGCCVGASPRALPAAPTLLFLLLLLQLPLWEEQLTGKLEWHFSGKSYVNLAPSFLVLLIGLPRRGLISQKRGEGSAGGAGGTGECAELCLAVAPRGHSRASARWRSRGEPQENQGRMGRTWCQEEPSGPPPWAPICRFRQPHTAPVELQGAPALAGRETWSCHHVTSLVCPVSLQQPPPLTSCPLPSLPELLGSAKKVNVNFQDTDG